MTKNYLSIDTIGFQKKPVGREIPIVKKRTAKNWDAFSLKEAAILIGENGHAMIPAHMEGGIKSENCTEMQFFVLDFDGGVTFREIKDKCISLGLPISFAYHTFSSCPSLEKFRVVFRHYEIIREKFLINLILRSLLKIFPEADRSCKDMGRMFFGGKELIYYDENAYLALVQLSKCLISALDNNGNYKRNLLNFSSETDLYLVNDKSPAMGSAEIKDLFFDENKDSASVYTVADGPDSSFCACKNKNLHSGKIRKETINPKSVDLDNMTGCFLLDDFFNGKELSHLQKFNILLSLIHIKNGKQKFLDTITHYEGTNAADYWNRNLKYFSEYHPASCREETCPYYAECNHIDNIYRTITNTRQITVEEETYYSIEEAYKQMENNLKRAIFSAENGIHLITAQTAIGKTTAYIKAVSEIRKKFLIAVPTLILRKEVYMRLLKWGIPAEDIFLTASIDDVEVVGEDLKMEIKANHSHGDHNVGRLVKQYMEENDIKDPCTFQYRELAKIVDGNASYKGERIVLATHASLLNMSSEFLSGFTVIIDEDIFMLQIMKQTQEVSMECLKQLSEAGLPGYSRLADRILHSEENKYYRIDNSYLGDLTDEQINSVPLYYGNDNFRDLRNAVSYVKYRARDGSLSCHYFCPGTLKAEKCIILSATLNADIYRQYFRAVKIIKYPEKKAAYKGRLCQYTYNSLGRSSIRKISDDTDSRTNFEKIKARLQCLTGKSNIETISFLSLGMQNSANIHFGNSTGLNDLAGKDLAIIGTPFSIDFSYKLVACAMGEDVNQKYDAAPVRRRLSYHGKSFLFQTFYSELLRTLQLYSIESELEQCIGRARLLRYDATVYLFSSFPCSQAEIHPQNYLLCNSEKM